MPQRWWQKGTRQVPGVPGEGPFRSEAPAEESLAEEAREGEGGSGLVHAAGGAGTRTGGTRCSRPQGPPLGARRVRRAAARKRKRGSLAPLPSAGRRRGLAAVAASCRYERGRAGVCHAAGPHPAWGARHRHAPRPRVLRGGGAGERRGGGRRAERSGPRLR